MPAQLKSPNLFLKLLLFTVFIAFLIFMAYSGDRRKKKILFFGDSITQQGNLAEGYITILKQILEQEQINKFSLIGSGIGGNKITDLIKRVDFDVIQQSPDLVVIFIGINDVWHKTSVGGTAIDEFERLYSGLVEKLLQNNIKVMLCTPTVIGEQQQGQNPQDEDIDAYCEAIRNIAVKEQLPLCDLRNLFMRYYAEHNAANNYKDVLTTDGVHLNTVGNRMVAKAMWQILKPVVL